MGARHAFLNRLHRFAVDYRTPLKQKGVRVPPRGQLRACVDNFIGTTFICTASPLHTHTGIRDDDDGR